LDRETGTLALAVVTILAVFVAVSPLLPATGERFSELGVLGPTQKIGGYPTSVVVGHQILLYGYVGDHEGRPTYYQVLVKVGDQSTAVSNSTAADAPVILTRFVALADNQSTTFPLSFSLSSPGLNHRIIFELWSYNLTSAQFSYTGLWNQLWVNVTSH
jgi:uncharacterized membrane protein